MRIDDKRLATLVMMRGLGYNQTEIAEALGVSQSTVQYQLRKLKEEAEKCGINHTFYRITTPQYVLQVIPP